MRDVSTFSDKQFCISIVIYVYHKYSILLSIMQ